ncbi:hypothetical protein D9M68_860150 [compost metagenome]
MPISGKRLGSAMMFRCRLSTALPMMARDLISSISVTAADSPPNISLMSERPGIAAFFCSTWTMALER